ncbi:MAG: hypothetical protein ACI8UX_000496 [Psychromonas sp.]|jgi:hypothetical protein
MIGREHEEEYCCLLRPYLSPNFLLSYQGKFPEPKILIEFQEEVIIYYKEVALGFEFGSSTQITRNGSDNMKIYVGGNKQDYLINDLNKVSNEINTLTQNGFQIRTVTDSSLANYYVFLGRRKSYGELFPSSKSLVTTN